MSALLCSFVESADDGYGQRSLADVEQWSGQGQDLAALAFDQLHRRAEVVDTLASRCGQLFRVDPCGLVDVLDEHAELTADRVTQRMRVDHVPA